MECDLIDCHPCFFSALACFLLSVLYVASLYVWGLQEVRNDSRVIRKRTISVIIVSLVSPLITKLFLVDDNLKSVPFNQVLGFRIDGIFTAATVPLILTSILFLGPMYLRQWDSECFHPDHEFLRNMVIAPMTEEITFRACMMPLLVQMNCMKPLSAVLVCPLLFGLAHVHHIVEKRKFGYTWKNALIVTAFQFFYTTLFGAYSALLFIKTGHFIAPLLAHVYCNWMGFPDFNDVLTGSYSRRFFLGFLFVLGLVLWCLLLPSLTNHTLYNNYLYTKIQASD